MKLRLGNTIIETDYIEYIQKLTDHSAKITFTSGEMITVICEGPTNMDAAAFEGDLDALLDLIENSDLQVSHIAEPHEKREMLDITDMDMSEILRAVAQHSIAQHQYLYEAAESLGIDIRTLRKYACAEEPDDAQKAN